MVSFIYWAKVSWFPKSSSSLVRQFLSVKQESRAPTPLRSADRKFQGPNYSLCVCNRHYDSSLLHTSLCRVVLYIPVFSINIYLRIFSFPRHFRVWGYFVWLGFLRFRITETYIYHCLGFYTYLRRPAISWSKSHKFIPLLYVNTVTEIQVSGSDVLSKFS